MYINRCICLKDTGFRNGVEWTHLEATLQKERLPYTRGFTTAKANTF